MVFMNGDDAAPWYLYPALNRDLVTTWWFGGGWMYFDYKHAEGGFPHLGKVVQGKTVDPFDILLEGVKKRGVQGKKIGIDSKLYADELETVKKWLPGVEFVDVSDVLLDMSVVKTPGGTGTHAAGVRLFRPGARVCAGLHSDLRDRHHGLRSGSGVDILDHEPAVLGSRSANGAPHHGVASEVSIECRVGPLTAYPHPNQPLFNRIQKGMALQVEGGAHIGGHGGENYRMLILADNAGKYDAHMQKLWEVSKHCCDMQVEMQKEGVTCSSIAFAIHKYQVEQSVQDYIYHRPAHGEGLGGASAALFGTWRLHGAEEGDDIFRRARIVRSKSGCGFNWSDCVVTGAKSGYRMSRVPYSKEYLWVKI